MDRIFLSLGAIAIVVVVVVVGVVRPELEETRQQRATYDAAMQAIERHEAEHWQENHMPVVQAAQRYTIIALLVSVAMCAGGVGAGVAIRALIWGRYAQEQKYALEIARIRSDTIIGCAHRGALPQQDSTSLVLLEKLLLEGERQ